MTAKAIVWLTTDQMIKRLDVSLSTLYRAKRTMMRDGVHFVRKNPASGRNGHLRWNEQAVREVFRVV
jgi:transposase